MEPTPTIPGLDREGWRPNKGDLFSRYVILQPIGRGGMGVVYAAYDPELERKVAIKILRADASTEAARAEAHHRLRREAQALARLNHPNILSVFDVGETEGRVFIATELVEGRDLHDWLAEPRPRRQVVRTFLAAGVGLEAAHAENIVHRDFKPANVMVDDRGGVKVVDFGLARIDRFDARPGRAADPVGRGGTPAFMAPEQRLGRPATPRSDQYSFALAFHHALYGRPPAVEGDERLDCPPSSPSGRVPKHVRRALRRALATEPDDRFESMAELLDALRPRPLAWRGATVAAVTVGVTAAIVWTRGDGGSVCQGGPPKLEGVWTPDRRAAVETSIAREGSAFARESATSVASIFDAYGLAWVERYRSTCLATHEHGEQSEAMLDLTMACLDRRLVELDALAEIFEAPESVAPARAIQAARNLVPLARCDDVRALRARQSRPDDPAIRTRIEIIERALARARAENEAGRAAAAKPIVEAAIEDARAFDYWPLRADALLLLATIESDLGDAESATATLERALRAAVAGHDERAAAEATVRQVRVTGYQLAAIDRGLELAAQARAIIGRLSAPEELSGLLDDHVGTLWLQRGDADRALEHHSRALDAKRRVLGSEHPEVANTLTRLGNVATVRGDHREALAYFERALETHRAALGTRHPRTAASLDRVGAARFNLADYDAAEAAHLRALEIRRDVHGDTHPRTASTLLNLGNVDWARGLYDASLTRYIEAQTILQAAHGPEHPHVALTLVSQGNALMRLARFDEAVTRFRTARAIQIDVYGPDHATVATTDLNLGEALLEQGDAARALDRFEDALGVWEAAYGADHATVGDALGAVGRAQLALGRAAEAVEALERARAIAEENEPDPTRLGIVRFALARARHAAGQADDRTLPLALQAHRDLARAATKNRQRLAEIDAWLTARGITDRASTESQEDRP